MAEERETQEPAGRASEPGTPDPQLQADRASTTIEVPLASNPTPQPDYAAELAALRQQNERHRQQIEGSASEARRLKEENDRFRTQMAQQQGLLQGLGQVLTGQNPQAAKAPPKDFAEAMNRFLAGDETALEGAAPMRQDDVASIVDQRLGTYLSYMQRQQAVTTSHPELADRSSPVYRDVYDRYDSLVQDPLVQQLYPPDPNMQVSIVSPDGTSQKTMDLRILDRAVLTAKAGQARTQGQQEEQRRQETGDAFAGSGRQSSSQGMQVEAWELLTPGEQAQYSDTEFLRMAQRSGLLPKGSDYTPKTLAKWVIEGLSSTERTKRVEDYRSRGTRRST